MKRPQDYIYTIYNRVEKLYKTIFTATMLIGILAHGYMFFNKISFHDDVASLFGVGATINSGRWGLEGAFLFNCIFLNMNFSMPVINGLISLLFIAFSACIVVRMFGIKSRFYGCMIAGIMTVFPVVASTFMFMFTAPYYFCALFFAVLATYLTLERSHYLWGTFLICFSLSLYQPYITVSFSIFVLYFIFARLEDVPMKENIKGIAGYFLSVIAGALLWGGINTVWKICYHIPLAQEGRMSTVTHITVKEMLAGIAMVYYNFFSLFYKDYRGLSNGHGIHIIYAAVFLLAITKVILTLCCFEMGKRNKLLYFIAVLLLPLAIGFMGILSVLNGIDVHTLTLYSYVFIPVGIIISVDKFEKYYKGKRQESDKFLSGKVSVIYEWTAFLVIMWCIVYYIRLDNMAYLKVDLTQRQADSYFTTLVTQIKSAEGYRDDMQVAVIRPESDSYDLKDASMYSENWYGKVTIYGADWDLNKWLTDAHWKFYLMHHCGFLPEFIDDTAAIEEMEEVKDMPCYPDEGSVKVVDDIVVVNFDSNVE